MIRDATPDDELAIAKVHLEAGTAGYGHLFEAAYAASLTPAGYSAMWRTRLAERHRRTLVADVEGEVRGFARFGSAPNAPMPPEAGTLEYIYVLPRYWGSGLGAALLAAAEEGLAAQGFTSAFLNVFEESRRAKAFYERHGWTHDRERWQVDRGRPVTQVRYVKPLSWDRRGGQPDRQRCQIDHEVKADRARGRPIANGVESIHEMNVR